MTVILRQIHPEMPDIFTKSISVDNERWASNKDAIINGLCEDVALLVGDGEESVDKDTLMTLAVPIFQFGMVEIKGLNILWMADYFSHNHVDIRAMCAINKLDKNK
jgi:hypothetical protein